MRAVNSLAKELNGVFSWHQARIMLLAQFMLALIKVRTINLTQVSQGFSGSALTASNYKRLQRFLRGFELDGQQCARVIGTLFCPKGKWVLCMDRTNWKFGKKDINFLVLAVARNGVAIPLFWMLLKKKGNSNTDERIEIMLRFVDVFGVEKIDFFTADREFRGREWFGWLKKSGIPFCIRIPNNTKADNHHKNRKLPVSRLFSISNHEQMILRRSRQIWGVEVYLSATKSHKGLMIVASSEPGNGVEKYRIRWEIETLFGCLKSRGFNLEDTHITDPERLSRLFFVLTLVFGWSLKMGELESKKKPIKLKKHGRKLISVFRLGLDILREKLLNPIQTGQTMYDFRMMLKVLSRT